MGRRDGRGLFKQLGPRGIVILFFVLALVPGLVFFLPRLMIELKRMAARRRVASYIPDFDADDDGADDDDAGSDGSGTD